MFIMVIMIIYLVFLWGFVWRFIMLFFWFVYNFFKINMMFMMFLFLLIIILWCLWISVLFMFVWMFGNEVFLLFMVKNLFKNNKLFILELRDFNGSFLNGLKVKKLFI